MAGVSTITYKGKEIIFIDGRNSTKEEGMSNFIEFDKLLQTQPPKSVLMLHDATGKSFNKEAMDKWKEASQIHSNYVRKSALVGAGTLLNMMMLGYRTFARLKGLDVDNVVHLFNTVDEAKEWLVQD